MLKKVSLIAVLTVVAAVSLQAAPWAASHNSRRSPKNLIVVGNYKTPRLMAATVMALTSQPYLVMTAEGRCFAFLPKATQEIPMDKVDVYINRLNPKRIVIIGDERFFSKAQEKSLSKVNLKRIPLIRIYGGDWGRIAEELDDMLNIGNLAREFRRNYFELSMSDSRLRDPEQGEEVQAPAKKDEAKEDSVEVEDLPASEPEAL